MFLLLTAIYEQELQSVSKLVDISCLKSSVHVQNNTPVSTTL